MRVFSSLQDGSPLNDNFGAQESCQEKVRCPCHHLTLTVPNSVTVQTHASHVLRAFHALRRSP